MKTLIINGSPRKNGDTAFLVKELKRHLKGEIVEISAYYDNVQPCIDCRACRASKGCVIKDDMQIIYDDDFDNVVIASPIYMTGLTGPLVSLASRFQAYYCAKYYLKDEFSLRRKKAALIITAGGDGNPNGAIRLAIGKMNAHGFEEHTVSSLETEVLPSSEDAAALEQVRMAVKYLNADIEQR